MLSELGERMAVFGLALHERKTRLRPHSCDLAHAAGRCCGPRPSPSSGSPTTAGGQGNGRFTAKHETHSERLTRKLKALCRGGVAADAKHRWPPSIAGTQP